MSASDVTTLLQQWSAGDGSALDRLLPLVYEDLRRLAHARMRREGGDRTLQTTALVHEAFLRLAGQNDPSLQHRGEFFHLAARLMRRILVDNARRRFSGKRGGGQEDVAFDEAFMAPEEKMQEWLEVNEALEKFAVLDVQRAMIVELRYFAGFSIEEIAELMGVSPATVKRDWTVARCWLKKNMGGAKHARGILGPGQ